MAEQARIARKWLKMQEEATAEQAVSGKHPTDSS